MKAQASNLMIGSLTLALIAGVVGAVLGYQKFAGTKQRVPLRVIFEGSASGLHKGGSVNFGGIRVGEVVSLKLDNPRRVVALAMIDNTAPVRKDTLAGLEFQGLTGVAALSLIGGSAEAPPVPLDQDGIPVLTADPDATQDVETKIKAALRNVDKVIADNQADLKDTMRNLETFTAALAANGERIDSVVRRAESGVGAVDLGLAKTDDLLTSVGSVDFGELLPTVQSIRELAQSFNKKSAAVMADSRKMLGDISASVNKADVKFGGPRR
jgi:phospholipid/cholesterol/gamma-HCH transport system substrate-binding protein